MKQIFYTFTKSLLGKLALIAALIVGEGNLAFSADVVIVDGNKVADGWTNGNWTKGFTYSGGSYSLTTYSFVTTGSDAITSDNGWAWRSLTSNNKVSIAENQIFEITAKRYASTATSAEILVRYSSDNNTYSLLKDFTTEVRVDEYVELTIDDNVPVGDYYVQVIGKGVNLSSFKIKDGAIPTTPKMSVTPNESAAFGSVTGSSTKTYTVANVGSGSMTVNISSDNTEEFSVSPIMLTGIENGNPQSFTITFNHSLNRLGERSANITVTPAYEGGSNVSIVASATAVDPNAADYTFDENTPSTWSASYSGSKKILLKYTPVDGWNTICTPFSLNSSLLTNIFGSGYNLFRFNSYSNGILTFEKAPTFSASTPYLVYVENAAVHPEGVLFEASSVYAMNPSTNTVFKGTYSPKTYAEGDDWYGVTSDGKVMQAGEGANLKGYRAYFTGISAPSDGARISLVFVDDQEGLGVSAAKWMEGNADAYNLQGQKVEKGRKGIYIVNGKKVIIK